VALISFHSRQAAQIENDNLRVTVLKQGGHIAEVFDKDCGVSPLWIPHWPSEEPGSHKLEKNSIFGDGPDAKLLAGIMGHNLCLDLFGPPSANEALAGLTVHGEASVLEYQITQGDDELLLELTLPLAQMWFRRTLQLRGRHIKVRETVRNLAAFDRPLAWTQHVTLGPPFLEPRTTQFRCSMGRSLVSQVDPGFNAYLKPGAEFAWPVAPLSAGGMANLEQMHETSPASSYTAHVTDPASDNAFFVAYSSEFKLAFGYLWKAKDFPWLGIWEENCSRQGTPWNGATVTRGMEFGVSPIPETRQVMVDRGHLLDTPTFRWLPARGTLHAEYWIYSSPSDAIVEKLEWPTE